MTFSYYILYMLRLSQLLEKLTHVLVYKDIGFRIIVLKKGMRVSGKWSGWQSYIATCKYWSIRIQPTKELEWTG
jgi:hypothetical protein